MTDWSIRQLTFGSDENRFHSHSYYDIPVMDDAGKSVICYQTTFTGRHPGPKDEVTVGLVAADEPGSWTSLGNTSAWSWQQGPMAQWVPGRNAVIWNKRDGDGFVANLVDVETGGQTHLPMPVYAVDPQSRFALSLSMARLNTLRPGYGYATLTKPALDPVPEDDGIWRLPLDGSEGSLILTLARAVEFLKTQLPLRAKARHWWEGYHYWFNHAKLSPSGDRFTVKLRWRKPDGGWNGKMGVSLTCGTDGKDLRLLAPATSHVIWRDDNALYYFAEDQSKVVIAEDDAPRGREIGQIGAGLIDANVHLRHLPPSDHPIESYVYDTPYQRDIDLFILSKDISESTKIATFKNHDPQRGPFRCDLHPCPDKSGKRIVVTSMQDGGRQVYVLDRSG